MATPFQKLPPGVYFNPTAEECVRDYLRPWKAGVPPATDRIINGVDVYSNSPAALVLPLAPGFSRGHEHKWFMLTNCTRMCGGKGRKARAKRDVATGGNWKVEQRSKGVADDKDEAGDDPPGGDRRRTNGFYLPGGGGGGGGGTGGKKDAGVKTPWLMEELTTEEDEVASATGWKGNMTIKVFCKLYVSPRASNEEKLQIFGEDRVPFDRDGKPKTAREALPEDLFDAVAASFYQAQGHAPAPPPRVLGCQQAQPVHRVVGHQHGGQPAALPPPVLGLHQQGVPGHQCGQPVAVLGHHHGHALMYRGVPAHHQHSHGQAAPCQIHGDPGQFYEGSGQCYDVPVHDHPYHQFHDEASPGVAGNLYSAPSFAHLDPPQQQGYEMIQMEKKPRLTLTHESPQPQPQGDADSDKLSCVVQASAPQEQCAMIKHLDNKGQCGDMDADAKLFEEAQPVPTPSPPQEVPGAGMAPPKFADDATMVPAVESMSDHHIFGDLSPLRQETFPFDDRPDLLMSEPPTPSNDKPPQPQQQQQQQPDFDLFLLENFDFPNF